MPKRVNYTSFGKEVEKALIDKNMAKGELAKAVGISQPYLTDILKGTRNGTERKIQIAKYLNLDLIVSK
ncbi:helix-turn-helix transcriptional regulator [Cellulosilyticum sp. ST5]|uniref:helix-turn-helix domain-containing protein n=1 Tax=Cellulosilyticum sp. ST5 TaxID=3055805 RepID=UPI0039778F10